MVNRALLNDAIQRALQKSDWFELDTYFKNVVEGIEDFQVFYELLPNFLRQVFGYEQVGFLDNLENFDMKNNSTIRYLGPRSNFFSSLEKSSSNFTFFFPVTNLPVWLQRAIEEKQSPVNSPNGEVRPALGKDAFLAFCKERLRKSAEGELELNATEYFLFCLIANTYWKRDFQVFEGDSMVSNRTFHPAMELKQFLNPKQQGSGKDQNQHCLRLEKWQFLHLLYLYIVYFIPRNEMLCLLNGRDIYFIRKYGELFWRLFCNFYIFTEEALTMGSLSLPSKFTFCVLTVAISFTSSNHVLGSGTPSGRWSVGGSRRCAPDASSSSTGAPSGTPASLPRTASTGATMPRLHLGCSAPQQTTPRRCSVERGTRGQAKTARRRTGPPSR